MLAAPTKKSKPVEWGAPLREYIVRTYGEKTADEQTESLSKLNQAREWTLNKKKADDATIENIKVYLRMLGAVEARFPIKETEINLNFTWYDSFKPTKKFTLHRISAERGATLFNYAAMLSYAGMCQDRGNPEGLQAACNYFSTSASYFAFLKDTYTSKMNGPLTSDMSEEGLSVLTNLMLAQVQACFFEKAVRNKLSPSVLSKLASGAHDLYKAAYKALKSPNLVEIIDVSWVSIITFQMRTFDASAHFQYSRVLLAQADETGEGYGERIAYLQSARQKCDFAMSPDITSGLPAAMVAMVPALRDAIDKELKKANDENKNIYLAIVPPTDSLNPVQPHILAKADMGKIDPLLTEPILPGVMEGAEGDTKGAELFSDLLPAELQIAVALFKSRISDMTERATKLVEQKEEEIKEALAGANLPAAIEAGGGEKGLSDSTWSKILESVHQEGGVQGLRSTLLGNATLANDLAAALERCSTMLRAEEAADMKHRQVWGAKWQMPLATEANSFIKKDCARFQGFLAEARESDRLLLAKIDTPPLKNTLDEISLPKAALDQLIPDPGAVDDDAAVEALRSNLRMSFIKLQTELHNNSSELQNFVYETQKVSILKELYGKDSIAEIANDEGALNKIIDSKLEVFEPSMSSLQSKVEEATTLLSRVLNDNSKYLAARRENSATKQREAVLTRIEQGIDEFTKLNKHITEGKKFYANLTEKVNRLQTLVNDHCLSRDLLGKEMEQNLIRSVETNTFAQPSGQGLVPPVSAPVPGPMFYNPSLNQPAAQPAPVFVQPPQVFQPQVTPNVAPQPVAPQRAFVPPASGMSLLDQMRAAQEEAERNGTLGSFAGADIGAAAAPAQPSATLADSVFKDAFGREQEEILHQIQMQRAIDQSNNNEYNDEVAQVKLLFGNEYTDEHIRKHLRHTNGNISAAADNIMDNIEIPEKKEKRGFFGRRKGKDKNKTAASAPATTNPKPKPTTFKW